MDAILTGALGSVPQLGGAGLLVVILVILVRREVQTTERHSAELTRMATAHDAELAELRAEVSRIRTAHVEAERELDAERRLRRQAQDAASPQQWGPPSAWSAG